MHWDEGYKKLYKWLQHTIFSYLTTGEKMVICFIGLIVFAILGIFSATHRALAKEAFECVFLKVTLRPCNSKLDQRLKSQITGKLLRKNPKAGRFVYKHFELISMIFTILTIISLLYSAVSVYNFAVYGNCEGQDSTGICIYNQIGEVITGSDTNQTSPTGECELPAEIYAPTDSGGTSGN